MLNDRAHESQVIEFIHVVMETHLCNAEEIEEPFYRDLELIW